MPGRFLAEQRCICSIVIEIVGEFSAPTVLSASGSTTTRELAFSIQYLVPSGCSMSLDSTPPSWNWVSWSEVRPTARLQSCPNWAAISQSFDCVFERVDQKIALLGAQIDGNLPHVPGAFEAVEIWLRNLA